MTQEKSGKEGLKDTKNPESSNQIVDITNYNHFIFTQKWRYFSVLFLTVLVSGGLCF